MEVWGVNVWSGMLFAVWDMWNKCGCGVAVGYSETEQKLEFEAKN